MTRKQMVYLFIAVIIIGLGYAGWKMNSRSAYEAAENSVLKKSDGKSSCAKTVE